MTGAVLLAGAGVLGSAGDARAQTAAPRTALPRTTDPSKPPLDVRVADVSGNTVTLAWDPPANNDFWWFYVYDNGAKEAVVGTGETTPTEITMKRLRPGMTHEFTMIYGEFIGLGDSAKLSAPSNPVRVSIPASSDTTPPTVPGNARLVPTGDGTVFLLEWDPSTDDVTPQDQIQYDFVDWTGFTNIYGVTNGEEFYGSGSVRAVDLAGNRSALSGSV